jgi:SnoaL-like domain
MTNLARSVVTRYLRAVARQDWDQVSGCLADDVLRRGPYGDDFRGATTYIAFLQRTMVSLPGYRMDVDKVSCLRDHRVMVELRETIDLDAGPLVTFECLVFAINSEGLLEEISIYIRQAPEG